ncbi:PAAR-like domain-containing protein [Kangiella shandongensis]|uniref:PAAR-like domain-containing protein n=1 Tax=Kangiella shandongensis TaxID=2763258 RepID=UPI001CBFC0F9|nr:PAAR-like domain-containing protein [Kangiella shandongensis]
MGKEAGRQIGDAKVTPLAPDFCKTPVGSSTPPLPYFPIGSFQDADGVTKTVFFTGKKVFTTNSHITKVVGNEPGKLGGVKSGVNKGYCVPKAMYSSTFRVEGGWVIRHDSLFEMNCSSPKGGGNVMGKAVYIKVTAMAYVGENGEIKAFTYDAEDTQNNKESLRYQNGTNEELKAMDSQLPDDAFQNPLGSNNLFSSNNNPMGIDGLEYNPEFGTYDYKPDSLDDFNYDNEIIANPDVEDALSSQRAAQAELDAANAEMARLEQEAQLDTAQAALGATGLIDPTPASDLVNAGISWSRGNYGEAILDGVSAFPYIGDLVAKPFKGGIVARRGINLARKLEKARAAKKAAMQKLADAKKQLQEAAANLKKNKKNAQNAANGKAADAVPPKSKKSQDQVKGDGKKKKGSKKKLKCGEKNSYKNLKKKTGGGKFDRDHVPSKAALKKRAEMILAKRGKRLSSEQAKAIENAADAIAIPRKAHQQVSPTYGGRNSAKRVIQDAGNLAGAAKRDTETMLKQIDEYDADGGCREAYKAAAKQILNMTNKDFDTFLMKTIKGVK